ncbi:MAG: four helix bundle protein [Bacteroidota bacterium]
MERESAKSFEDLIVWQKAHRFVLEIYNYTATFPKQETYGLISQLRRAAISIPVNIAEKFKKHGHVDKVRFMNIAQGSAEECRYYLILSTNLHYGKCSELKLLLNEVTKLLCAYSKRILPPVS